ncbi:MAG: EAL domain-containing protein [Cyanobacteria bacterium P01_D01_bin.115]
MALLMLSYVHALTYERNELQSIASLSARQMTSLIRAAEITLKDLETYFSQDRLNDARHLQLLQRTVYRDPRFREIGVVNEAGALYLTSLGFIEPPILLQDRARLDLSKKELQILGPLTTQVMQERSLVLALPTQGQGEINILVDPILLSHWLEINGLELGPDGYIAFVRTADQEIIDGAGQLPREGNILSAQPARDRLQLSQSLDDIGVTIVVNVSRAWILRDWRSFFQLGVPIALLSSSLMALAAGHFVALKAQMEQDLRKAIANDELELYYQPILDIETEQCVGAEALIRWQHAARGLLLPDAFIPLAEKTKLIIKIGEWVIKQVLQTQADLLKKNPHLYISVNLSPVQITSEAHSKRILSLLKTHPEIAPHLLFEITENVLVEDAQMHIPEALASIRACGAKLALDDFGSGYCGINYLSKLNVDYLKIDRKFVSGSDVTAQTATVLEGIIDLGNRLQMTVVAEGVETEAQRQTLIKKGVRYGQGYLWSRPMPAHEFALFVAESSPL